jgi:DNA-binding MarR family transcriptional regulator
VDKRADQQTLEAWKGILFCHARVVRALEADLVRSADLPLTWFDVMMRLNEQTDGRLRVHELADASLFTRSGLTRLIDRIEEAGFVVRQHSSEDRRGVYVVLTEEGRNKIAELWPEFTASIEEHFGRFLSSAEEEAVIATTERVLAGVDPRLPKG